MARPTELRILRITEASVIHAILFTLEEPQRLQVKTSIAQTRAKSSAQQSRLVAGLGVSGPQEQGSREGWAGSAMTWERSLALGA